MKKSSLLVMIALFILLAIGVGVGGYFLGMKKMQGQTVQMYALTENISAGQSLKGKYSIIEKQKTTSINQEDLVLDMEELDNSIAICNMYRNQEISKSSITRAEDKERTLVFAMPVTVEGTVANMAQEGNMCAIKVRYTDNDKEDQEDDVVIGSISVYQKRTSDGLVLQEGVKGTPAFVLFKVTDEEMNRLNSARKKGDLYLTLYSEIDKELFLEETYK